MHIPQKLPTTEAEWLAATLPGPLLEYVWQHRRRVRLRGYGRQLRLFACACFRRAWHLLPERRLVHALQTCERYADGLADDAERSASRAEAHEAANRVEDIPRRMAAYGVWSAADSNALEAAYATQSFAANALMHEARAAAGDGHLTGREARAIAARTINAEWGRHCLLARDIVGNPFRRLPVRPACLTPQVVALAQAAYEQRDLPAGTLDVTRLAVLADALEEAGCTGPDLLGHLRGPGPHVRGCWAVDLLLGKR